MDSDEFVLLCYSLEEILIEKMCALMGRTQPRDYYDLWYLLEIEGMDIEYFWPEFERKAANKNHNPKELNAKLEKNTLFLKEDGKAPYQIKSKVYLILTK